MPNPRDMDSFLSTRTSALPQALNQHRLSKWGVPKLQANSGEKRYPLLLEGGGQDLTHIYRRGRTPDVLVAAPSPASPLNRLKTTPDTDPIPAHVSMYVCTTQRWNKNVLHIILYITCSSVGLLLLLATRFSKAGVDAVRVVDAPKAGVPVVGGREQQPTQDKHCVGLRI